MSQHSTTDITACGDCAGTARSDSGAESARALPVLERREFLSRATLAALGVMLVACGGSSGGPTSPTTLASLSVKLADYPMLATVGGVAYVTSGSTPLALVRTDAATIAAFSRVCPHQGGTVAANSSEFVCPVHGARFNLTSGAWTGGERTSSLTRYPSAYDATAGTVTIGG